MIQSLCTFSRHLRAMCAIGGLMLLLVACGDSETDATPTDEAVVAAPTETLAPTTPSEPSATPTEEPSPTPTLFVPAPTVAAPLYIPPTAIPTQVPAEIPTEAPPEGAEEEVPFDQGDSEVDGPTVGELLYVEDLSTWPVAEYGFGHSYVHEGAYYIYNTSSLGEGFWSRTGLLDEADLLASIDLIMTTPNATDTWGCLLTRADWESTNFTYSLCINGWGESYAAYQTIDSDGTYHYDMLVDIATRDALGAPTQVNNLSIMSFGIEFAFFINGQLIGTAEHVGEPQGAVGFFVSNYGDEHAEFGFANLEIWEVLP